MPQPSLRCPRCPSSTLTDGPFHDCKTCGGVWIAEQSLEQHVGRLPAPGTISCEVSKIRVGLACAECGGTMQALNLMLEPVDRCKDHGIWFDKHELRAVIERSKRAQPVPAFHRQGAARPLPRHSKARAVAEAVMDPFVLDVAIDGAEATVEIIGEIGTSGIADALLEVIGGIFSAIGDIASS